MRCFFSFHPPDHPGLLAACTHKIKGNKMVFLHTSHFWIVWAVCSMRMNGFFSFLRNLDEDKWNEHRQTFEHHHGNKKNVAMSTNLFTFSMDVNWQCREWEREIERARTRKKNLFVSISWLEFNLKWREQKQHHRNDSSPSNDDGQISSTESLLETN